MKYVNRFPKEIVAFEVIKEELQEIAQWCGGEVMVDSEGENYIFRDGLEIYPECVLAEDNGVFMVVEEEVFDFVYEKVA